MNNNGWVDEFVHTLTQTEDLDETFAAVARAARALGFVHCAYGLRVPLAFTRPRVQVHSTYATGWQERYAQAGYMAQDPTVAHALHSTVPLVWSDKLFAESPQMWDEARSWGLSVGWCQSHIDGDHCAGMLTVARDTEPIGPSELAAKEMAMRWLVQAAHHAMGSRVKASLGFQAQALTPRQVEILQWTADGKTTEQVGQILALSTDTVNYHFKTIMDRFRVSNRAAAVARASRLGLLG